MKVAHSFAWKIYSINCFFHISLWLNSKFNSIWYNPDEYAAASMNCHFVPTNFVYANPMIKPMFAAKHTKKKAYTI